MINLICDCGKKYNDQLHTDWVSWLLECNGKSCIGSFVYDYDLNKLWSISIKINKYSFLQYTFQQNYILCYALNNDHNVVEQNGKYNCNPSNNIDEMKNYLIKLKNNIEFA